VSSAQVTLRGDGVFIGDVGGFRTSLCITLGKTGALNTNVPSESVPAAFPLFVNPLVPHT